MDSAKSEYKILVVDDEPANLHKMRRTFINRYPVLAAGSGKEALGYVEKDNGIAVIVADQRMPDMSGIELLRCTLESLPHAVRIILTGFTDVDVLMEAINSCKVFRYIIKPWDPSDLLMTVERGLESYRLAAENEQFRKELVRRERLARELEIAREIQRYILPTDSPVMDKYEIAAEYHPAREVGGDLFDFDFDPSKNTLQIVIGDVSGKSIPAALYGAVFSGQIQTLFAHSLSPGETLGFLNSNLVQRYRVNNYIAVATASVDLRTGRGRLANGGMPYPYLVRKGEITPLTVTGVPLGLFEESSYDELEFQLGPDDLLILASDGVTDALNSEEEMYEEVRFLESVKLHAAEPVSQCVRSLYEEIRHFAGNADVHDDITILALHRHV